MGASKRSAGAVTDGSDPVLRADTAIAADIRRTVIRHGSTTKLDPIGRVLHQSDQLHHPAAVEAHGRQTSAVRRSMPRPHVPRQAAANVVLDAAQVDPGTAQVYRPGEPLIALGVIQGHPYHLVLQLHRDAMWLTIINAARPCIQHILA